MFVPTFDQNYYCSYASDNQSQYQSQWLLGCHAGSLVSGCTPTRSVVLRFSVISLSHGPYFAFPIPPEHTILAPFSTWQRTYLPFIQVPITCPLEMLGTYLPICPNWKSFAQLLGREVQLACALFQSKSRTSLALRRTYWPKPKSLVY